MASKVDNKGEALLRIRFAAFLLPALMVLGAANLIANVAYMQWTFWYDIAMEQEVSMSSNVTAYAFFSVPSLIQAVVVLALIVEGTRYRRKLAAGDEWARDRLHRISYACIVCLAVLLWWTAQGLEASDARRGFALGALPELESYGTPYPMTWVGLASLLAIPVLLVGAIGFTVATRKVRAKAG